MKLLLVACSVVAAFLLAMFFGAFLRHWPSNSGEWASWAQAIGVAFAVAGSFAVARYQIRTDRQKALAEERKARRKAIEEERTDQARQLLGLQQLSSELAQMCLLTNFEKSNLREGSIYPDAAGEFRAMAELLGTFQAVGVTALGEMEKLLYMRRIAIGSALIFERDRELVGDTFTLKHRTTFLKYNDDCSRFARELAIRIEALAPNKFTDRIRRHL